METSLVIDTETTGKLIPRAPPWDFDQPKIVQFAAVLLDREGEEVNAVNLIVNPGDTNIPEEAAKIHGITSPMARAYGVRARLVLDVFVELLSSAGVLVAHNLAFDLAMLDALACRLLHVKLNVISDGVPGQKHFCTMLAMVNECRLPGYKADEFKWPTLTEAYHHCFGEDFVAHNAMSDVRACARIYKWLKMAKKA